ncbi:MAG: cytochrome c [Nannocystaceae bacterium]
MSTRAILLSTLAVALLAGCQGNRSDQPPVHLIDNMDFQKRYDAQEVNDFYTDLDCPIDEKAAEKEAAEGAEHGEGHHAQTCWGRAMREAPAGTVAVGFLKDDDHLYRGRGPDGRLADALPQQIVMDEALLHRGEERYNIYCQPCHDYVGGGQGVATLRGGGFSVQPPSYHIARLRAMPLGYFFKVISDGQGTMQSYAAQIPVEDRWAIAAWVRTLQVSRTVKGVK